jgi:hypothetical protein
MLTKSSVEWKRAGELYSLRTAAPHLSPRVVLLIAAIAEFDRLIQLISPDLSRSFRRQKDVE